MGEEGFFEGTKKGTVIMKVTKEEKELFQEIRKIKPAQWKEMNSFMGEAKDILAQGGLTSFFKSEFMQIKDDLINDRVYDLYGLSPEDISQIQSLL